AGPGGSGPRGEVSPPERRAGTADSRAAKKRRPFVLFRRLDYYDRSCYCQVMSTTTTQKTSPRGDEPRPSKGQASRATILLAAARLATTRGLDGLSIGDLAAEVGMSKSGLYAHFKSKEELELATIETAVAIFDREVLQPAARAHPGTERLGALVDAFLSHLERRGFPGGGFFAAVRSGIHTRPRPARGPVVPGLDQVDLLVPAVPAGRTGLRGDRSPSGSRAGGL